MTQYKKHSTDADANIDYAEVSKFDGHSHDWWNLEGELQTLHQINPLRVQYINQRHPIKASKTIDIGCGGGILSEALALQGAEVTGIDMAAAPLAVAREHAKASDVSVNYQQSTAEAFAEKHQESFELVTCLEMLEHVPDPESVIKACAKLASPGANLFFSTINRSPKSYLIMIVGAEYILNKVPRGTHDYKKLIRPSELGRWVRNAGLELVELKGMVFNPITNQASLSKDTGVNYFAHCRKPE